MDSSSHSPQPQRHGWPQSAPPKRSLETSLENLENSNFHRANHDPKGHRYSLPPHQIVQASIPRQSQRRTQLRHSAHAEVSPRPTNVNEVKSSRTFLPSNVPSNLDNVEKCNRRAVVIAATYKGTRGVARKCEDISHVTSLFQLLTVTLNFKKENVWMLTDAPEQVAGCPVKLGATRRNILTSLKWLISGSKEGDVLFFGFSGLGVTINTQDSHQVHVTEDCLLPTDYPSSSPIPQTHLASLIANGLHTNATLTALIDTKDCSKILKLPYIKHVHCVSKAKFVITERSEHGVVADEEKQKEASFIFKYNRAKHEYNRMRRILEKEERDALMSLFSESGKVFAFGFGGASESDYKTSKRKPIAVGALTRAFAECVLQHMKTQREITYSYLLQSMCEAIATKRNSQLPQVASSHGVDLCATLALVEDRG